MKFVVRCWCWIVRFVGVGCENSFGGFWWRSFWFCR